ncbi:DUF2851 family protein [Polaribacter sp. IC073]|uniref:DUF2851 family protein n=1 Tax=Polaribacter sp. IC073 TaxID=2508540 RepID=UPI0011BEE490|nr:DUF2851 family protein [Polaribacter sp. IC073]TXD48719.1 DUF2851 family protein [Polaribacter sp. IC073]
MNEDFLQYVWKYKMFSKIDFKTTNNERLTIIKPGLHNKNAGPDFLNAHLKIENQTWIGNVEIHLKASDWYVHHHEIDVNYDAVILHVVWENDADIFMKNNKPIPTFVLKDLINEGVLNNYRKLFFTPTSWIPCDTAIATIDSFTLANWKERLFFERLERKSEEINGLLQQENNNFEAVLFQLLAKNFGLKINGDVFLRLAQSVPFSILQKMSFNENQFAALLFGQAGFLSGDVQDEYYQQLKIEYTYLKHKYKLNSLPNSQFSFFRMRPNNFPTIRIAQLVSLFQKHQNLFSKLIEINNLKEFYELFSIEMNLFWKTHYNFESLSKTAPKKLSNSFVDLLIINTIIPLQFLYQKSRGEVDEESFLEILKEMKPEKNNIISKFSEIKIKAKSAFDSQALLELKNNYCAPKRCLECAIGVQLLKR